MACASVLLPMTILTEKDIAEFQALFKAETGKDITPEQAREYGERVLRLVSIIANLQPPPSYGDTGKGGPRRADETP
jgi:hypothetical protein